MKIANLILEYVKIILSPQVIAGSVLIAFLIIFKEDVKALLLRIAKIKLPGGTELTTSQTQKTSSGEEVKDKPIPTPEANDFNLPQFLNSDQKAQVNDLLLSERAKAYLWEYRYLNYFLVRNSQEVLNWLLSLKSNPTIGLYDATWLPLIPSVDERNVILNALQNHHLIMINNDVITVSPKGKEYVEWRGPLPELPNITTKST